MQKTTTAKKVSGSGAYNELTVGGGYIWVWNTFVLELGYELWWYEDNGYIELEVEGSKESVEFGAGTGPQFRIGSGILASFRLKESRFSNFSE